MATIFSFLLLGSINVSAQKSVYDVIPGSGPKKTTPTATKTSLPDVIRNDKGRTDHDHGEKGEHHRKAERKHLPPGQAKKVYGGSAKDYAPGQVKKHKRNKHSKHHKHGKHHKDKALRRTVADLSYCTRQVIKNPVKTITGFFNEMI